MKKKQWEPETLKGYSFETVGEGRLIGVGFEMMKTDNNQIAVRILREKDYQRLLKLARKTPKRTP